MSYYDPYLKFRLASPEDRPGFMDEASWDIDPVDAIHQRHFLDIHIRILPITFGDYKAILNGVRGNHLYQTLEDAREHVFTVLMSGKAQQYLARVGRLDPATPDSGDG